MSVLAVSPATRFAFDLGVKLASDLSPSYELGGTLHLSEEEDGRYWLLLSVPNALVRGVFAALTAPGAELPPGPGGRLNAHITVMHPDEVAQVGGPDALTHDRGQVFKYTIGRLVEFEPEGWANIARCWALHVYSPALATLRRSYGLSPLPRGGDYVFHITCAVRRRGVLGRGATGKGTS